jgi:aspartate/methionine/tyrosine aminotransferase
METPDEINGKAYVHYKSWHETYKGLIADEHLKKITEELCRSIANIWPDNLLVAKDGDRVINNSSDFAMYLLEVGHVATVGGDAFGSPECFRMSYATSDENIIEAMKRIKETLARLK